MAVAEGEASVEAVDFFVVEDLAVDFLVEVGDVPWVVVAVVLAEALAPSCLCAQELRNATPARIAMKDKRDVFIVVKLNEGENVGSATAGQALNTWFCAL